VAGESPIVDTSTTAMGTYFTKELLRDIPNARDIWAAMSQAPGLQMTAFDVGDRIPAIRPDIVRTASTRRTRLAWKEPIPPKTRRPTRATLISDRSRNSRWEALVLMHRLLLGGGAQHQREVWRRSVYHTTFPCRPADRLWGDDGLETTSLWNYKVIGRYVMPLDIGLSGSWKVQSGFNYARTISVAMLNPTVIRFGVRFNF
jgi:hypothetical protein